MYLIACAAIVGYTVAYGLCDFSGWPRLTYFPLHREWDVVVRPRSPYPMNYVGTTLWGVGGAVIAAAIAAVATRLARGPLPARWLHLSGAWALTAFALVGFYYTWNLWPF